MSRMIYLTLALAIVISAAALAAVSIPGGIDVASDTASFERNYGGNAIGLSIAPETADIQVLIYPLKHTGNDTIVVKGGDVMTWEPLRHTGFKVIRPSATAVQCYWW